LMNADEPPTTTSSQNHCTMVHVLKLLHSMLQMISISMSLDVTNDSIVVLATTIQYFLTNYSIFIKSLDYAHSKTKKKKCMPAYLRHYNFMSLLNLPQQMKNFGSLRLLWEGGMQGEGYLRNVKGEIKRGLNNNWPKWVIESLLIDKGYSVILDRVKGNNNNKLPSVDISGIKIYKNKSEAESIIKFAKPFSAIHWCCNDETITYICYRNDKTIKGVEITIDYPVENIVGYMKYYEVTYTATNTMSNKKPMRLENCNDGTIIPLLFLPLLGQTGYPSMEDVDMVRYCIVNSNWIYNDA
jgi:hypothetical protein